MKKIFLFVLISFTISSFAQKSDFDQAITKLMYAKKGMSGVENVGNDLIKGIPTKNQNAFRNEMNTLKENFIQFAKSEFQKKYSTKDINEIYLEFTSNAIDYTDKTNDFFKYFRSLKGKYFSDAKQLYAKYIN